MSFRLDMIQGSTRKQLVFAQKVVRVGREATNDLVLYDTQVSRVHCEILRDGDDYTLRDVGSANGTLLNEQFTTEAVLAEGDRIQVGPVVFEFHREHNAKAPSVERERLFAPATAAQQQKLEAVKTRFLQRPRTTELVRANAQRRAQANAVSPWAWRTLPQSRRRALLLAACLLVLGALGALLIVRSRPVKRPANRQSWLQQGHSSLAHATTSRLESAAPGRDNQPTE